MNLMCSECEGFVDIMSIEKITSDYVRVTFICKCCGKSKIERHYIYKLKIK